MAISTPLFTQHSRRWQSNRFVYPVISRRSRGLSIGVNLNPDKACNFACVYCSVDRGEHAPAGERDVDLAVVRQELDDLLAAAASGAIWQQPPFDSTPAPLRRLNDVAFSGDGEPTSFPAFGEACRLAAELLAWHALGEVKIVVITNATLLDRPEVRAALAHLDRANGEIWAKLDAGSEAYYQRVERSKVPLRRVLDNLLATGRQRPLVIQSLFMRLDGEGPSAAEIAAYIGRLRDLLAGSCQIKLVQVYTVARATAEAFVTPLPVADIEAIAAQVRTLGVEVAAYHAPQ